MPLGGAESDPLRATDTTNRYRRDSHDIGEDSNSDASSVSDLHSSSSFISNQFLLPTSTLSLTRTYMQSALIGLRL